MHCKRHVLRRPADRDVYDLGPMRFAQGGRQVRIGSIAQFPQYLDGTLAYVSRPQNSKSQPQHSDTKPIRTACVILNKVTQLAERMGQPRDRWLGQTRAFGKIRVGKCRFAVPKTP